MGEDSPRRFGIGGEMCAQKFGASNIAEAKALPGTGPYHLVMSVRRMDSDLCSSVMFVEP